MTEAFAHRPTTLADYLGILRRRKWIILALPIVAAASAYAVARTQSPLYSAGAQILVDRSSIVSAITNISDPSIGDPTRFLATEASVGESPVLAARVARIAGIRGLDSNGVLNATRVTPDANADLLDVTVELSTPAAAVRLVNVFANQFTAYKSQLDTQRVDQALARLEVRLKTLQSRGATASASYATLLQQQSQLETVGTLLAHNMSVLRPADGASQVRPRPLHSGVLGGLLGLVLGVALAFVAEALDRRVRSERELEHTLGLPLLGRLAPPPRRISDSNALVMLAEPDSPQAESFRRLKTSIEFLNLDRNAKTLMITSAIPGEGKSTTTANLAVAFARAGKRVALVDLDLRRPFLHSFFYTGVGRGVSDVIAGGESLEAALRPVTLSAGPSLGVDTARNGGRKAERARANGSAATGATMHLLPSGTVPAASGDAMMAFLEHERLAGVLDDLSRQFDLVLIDTPPLLAVGDAMALTSRVDAVIVVLHAGVQRPLLRELGRELQSSRAAVLGFVVTGAGVDREVYGYGYGSYAYDAQRKHELDTERV